MCLRVERGRAPAVKTTPGYESRIGACMLAMSSFSFALLFSVCITSLLLCAIVSTVICRLRAQRLLCDFDERERGAAHEPTRGGRARGRARARIENRGFLANARHNILISVAEHENSPTQKTSGAHRITSRRREGSVRDNPSQHVSAGREGAVPSPLPSSP